MAWGKLERDASGEVSDWLPLTDHCCDVAATFLHLIHTPGIRRALEALTGPLLPAQFERLAVLAYLHDLGKCNAGFYAKKENTTIRASHVREASALFFDDALATNLLAMPEIAQIQTWFTDQSWGRVLLAAISHHGRPAFSRHVADTADLALYVKLWRVRDGYDPLQQVAVLLAACRNMYPGAFDRAVPPVTVTVAFEHLFAGLVMLADWVGSNRRFFPFRHSGERPMWSRDRAARALLAIGLDRGFAQADWKPLLSFQDIFGFPTRPLQSALATADLPSLVIAESDTGSGKTEAALTHFFHLFAAGKVDGLYFALPTRVAAREIYERVLRAARTFFGEACPPVLLAVPGYAKVDGSDAASLLPEAGVLWHEDDLRRSDRCWSAERPKRFLAASVAIGTIDQVLISTIQVPHAHLRAACLARALLVIDEVHASDVYMRHLTREVLKRHLAQGGRALLLSATLGAAVRAEYLDPSMRAPSGPPFKAAVELAYPSLSSPGAVSMFPAATGRSKQVMLQTMTRTPSTLSEALRSAVGAGQRVLVVLNTVTRAIELGRLVAADPVLVDALFVANGIACVHHGRFARADREVLDAAVSKRLGKGSAAGPALLVGTQTLEQSLDIDADVLFTDLCPIDVLLQRIGRLHRHDRGPRATAVCKVIVPRERDLSVFIGRGGEVFRSDAKRAGLGSVYEDLRVLQLTRDLLDAKPSIEIPRDNRLLVETATHPERLGSLSGDAWRAHAQRIEGIALARAGASETARIPEEHFGDFEFQGATNGALAARLGLQDRLVTLPSGAMSPFGQVIDAISVPGHLTDGIDPDHAAEIQPAAEGFIVQSGSARFSYTRFGLERLAK
jgi:CRISPR-associated endonuclease/helicase Cas3